ncbi:ImmA/IrrE family metallo-endopeptidase [Methylophilus flavus]|uniref:ImmA/IrrE family metallo-endopeptidase n=1 Tax=Methylophilus flavus TaxID=640084 RepID=A0ABW3P935_9PROT
MNSPLWTPNKAAIKLIKVIDQFSAIHALDRFPTDIPAIALETANIFGWDDPITIVKGVDIKKFDGALMPDEDRKKWLLLYNQSLDSLGRIRFTQAHELGHYILHRTLRDNFQCGDSNVLSWPGDEENIETQADEFASSLLMPINDFREQTNTDINLDVLSFCASRYGVSLTATVLKWIKLTLESAVLILSKSGYIEWAWSSASAMKAGAYFKTQGNIIEVPQGTLAADESLPNEMFGKNIAAASWFKNSADKDSEIKEMKVLMDKYERVLTLLVLSKNTSVWPEWSNN